MLYPEYIQHRRPEINLPYPKHVKTFVFDFYHFTESNSDPRIEAKCKHCGAMLFMMKGVQVSSSYTSGLVSHLQKHPNLWQDYLDLLKKTITPDSKTPRQHFQSRISCNISTNKDESSKNLQICTRNFNLNKKNCAGIVYVQRDIEILRNQISYEHQNAKILQYIQSFTNQNIHIFELIGTKHPGARLDRSYKKTKSLVDNDGDIIIDLERLFCEHLCFFDPDKYGDCPNEQYHKGEISIFSDIGYQKQFDGFDNEIERYPEFQGNKSFDFKILKEIERIEHDKIALREMNRLLKILLSLIIVQKPKINEKIAELGDSDIGYDRLRKPNLGLQGWGPKIKILDFSSEEDSTDFIPESEFSTFQHVKISECPAYSDNSKKASHKPHFENYRAYYPCNTGSCLKLCVCKPCTNRSKYSKPNSFKCPNHSIDHPEMFDVDEDLAISRRQFVNGNIKQPIFRRPSHDSFLCPPSLNLAQMKKNCKFCINVFEDHKKHHHIIHEACQICSHLVQRSQIKFSVTCYLCFKIFKNKYKLGEHMRTHDEENPFFCIECEKNFTNKHNYETHIASIHRKVQENFKCDTCGEVFTKRFNLTRHKNDKHTEDKERFSCTWCNSTFQRRDTLLRHERTNHGKVRTEALLPGVNKRYDPFECHKCKRVFKDKNSLIRHLESVHEKVSFSCTLCFQTFKRKDTLHIHMKTHTNNPPKIICEICRQEFETKMELRAHRIETHENKNK